jgi:hypothetical protein
MFAVERVGLASTEVVKLLLDKGADATATDEVPDF